jgi:hypothetical protein
MSEQTAADKVEADYARSLSDNAWLQARPELLELARAQQAAYVAWMRAYAARFPAEAHLLPSAAAAPDMPELAAYRAAARAYDRAAEHVLRGTNT